MTKNEDILKPFEVIERQTLEVENVVEKNKYFTISFFSQLYTKLDTCQKCHPYDYNNGKIVIHESHMKVSCLNNWFSYVYSCILASALMHAHIDTQ